MHSSQLFILYIFLPLMCIGSTIIIWYSFKFHGINSLLIIKKRYPKITILITILSCFLILSVMLLDIIILSYSSSYNHYKLSSLSTIVSIFNIIIFDAIIYLVLLRFWSMYFDVKWTISHLNADWIIHLNPDQLKIDWYLQNKQKYGNLSFYILKKFIIFYLLSILLPIVIYILIYFAYLPIYLSFFHILSHFCPICVNIYIYNVTPTFYDHFYMRDEMNAINIIFILYLLFELIHNIFELIFVNKYHIYIYCHIIYLFIKLLLIWLLCIISTAWIIYIVSKEYGSYNDAKQLQNTPNMEQHTSFMYGININNVNSYSKHSKNKSHIQNNKEEKKEEESEQQEEEEDDRMPVFTRKKKALEEIEISQKIKLPKILSKNESFALFMQHLSRESSSRMQCLLSFVEYYQFKELLKDNLTDINIGTFGNASLASNIPKSAIVYKKYEGKSNSQSDLLREYKCRAYQLYCKYINSGAELELRLEANFKNDLHEKLNDMDNFVKSNIDSDELFHIFDDVIFSQYRIMLNSYNRFVKTGDYSLVEALFNQEKA